MNRLDAVFRLIPRTDRWQLALLCPLIIGNAILETISIAMVLPLIELVTDPTRMMAQPRVKALYDLLQCSSVAVFATLCGLTFLVAILVKNAYFYGLTKFQSRFINRGAATTASRLFRRYLAQPYIYHLNRNSAELINRIQFTVHGVFGGAVLGYIGLTTESVMLALIIGMLLTIEPTFTLTAGLVLVVCFGPIYLMTRRTVQALGRDSIALQEERQKALQQSLSSVKDVKVLGREAFFQHHLADIVDRYAETQVRTAVINQIPKLAIETLLVTGIVSALLFSLWQSRDTGGITALLALFAAAAFRLMPSINRLLMAVNNVRFADEAVRQLEADFADCPAFDDAVDPASELAFRDEIRIEGVSFAYSNGRDVLSDLCLNIAKGESIGLVGPSGSGKSTLVDVLLGLLSPSAGRIFVDGTDISVRLRSWQRTIGYVPQSVSLIDDSLRNNVAFGVEPAAIDIDRVWRGLAMAQLANFVHALPQGLDTSLGERGVRLSGGQRQRIGIARALYEDPQILILDEATAALDNQTEHEITTAIDGLRGEKTLIIIAHRLSTIRRCDRIVLLKEGRIEAIGSFDELRSGNSHFQHMLHLAEMIREAPEDVEALT